MSEEQKVSRSRVPSPHTGSVTSGRPDITSIIVALQAALATEDHDVRWAWIQAALDFAQNDPEVLAEGRAWADISDDDRARAAQAKAEGQR